MVGVGGGKAAFEHRESSTRESRANFQMTLSSNRVESMYTVDCKHELKNNTRRLTQTVSSSSIPRAARHFRNIEGTIGEIMRILSEHETTEGLKNLAVIHTIRNQNLKR